MCDGPLGLAPFFCLPLGVTVLQEAVIPGPLLPLLLPPVLHEGCLWAAPPWGPSPSAALLCLKVKAEAVQTVSSWELQMGEPNLGAGVFEPDPELCSALLGALYPKDAVRDSSQQHTILGPAGAEQRPCAGDLAREP